MTASRPPRARTAGSPRVAPDREALIRGVCEASADAALVVSADGTILVANTLALSLFGYGRDALEGQPIEVLVPMPLRARHGEERTAFATAPRRVGTHDRGDLRCLRADGTEFLAEIGLGPIATADGPLTLCSVRDTTRLREAETITARLVESAPAGVIVADADGRIRVLNDEAERLFGYRRDELIGEPIERLLPGARRDAHRRHREGYRAGPTERRMDQRTDLVARRRDGREFPVEVSLCPLDLESGPLFVSMVRDVSERREADATRAHLAAIADATTDAIVGQTLDGEITSWNPAAQALYGYSAAEVIGRPVSILAPPDRLAELDEIHELLRRGHRVDQLETVRVHRDGRLLDVSLSVTPVRGDDRRPAWAASIARDVSERKRADEERTARLRAEAAVEARDRFISIAAHELRTPITGLHGYAQFTMRQLQRDRAPGPVEMHDRLRTIADQSERLARLVAQLLDIAALEADRVVLDRQRTDVREIAERLAHVMNVRDDIEPRIVLAAGPPAFAEIDALRVEQVLANLLHNAVKFSPRDATVEIGVTEASGAVEISVRDHGPGIPDEHRERIFDRYYQAPESRVPGGLGLGLFITREIVERHCGTVRVDAPEGGGTRFVVTLPAEAPAA